MVSRERLLRLGAAVVEHATTKRARAVAQLLLLAAIVFVALRVRSLWHGGHIVLGEVEWGTLAGAFLLTGAGVLGTGFIWLAILTRLGTTTERRWSAIFFQAQLAKYIPGTLWQYAGRLTLARTWGLPTRTVARSMPIELAASIAAAGAASLLLLGLWGIPAAIAATSVCLVVARRARASTVKLSRDISAGAVAMPLYAIVWVILGSAFWLTAHAFLSVSVRSVPFYTGAFAAAWIVGVVAVYAPGGLGVREGVLVGLLHSRLGSADALVLAAASRVLLALIDIFLATAAFFVLRRSRKPADADSESPALSFDPPKSTVP